MVQARIATSTLVYDNWFRLRRLEVNMPDGERAERHMVEARDAVSVLPYDAARRTCILVTQPRAPVLDAGLPALFEVISGMLDRPGPEEQIRLEAMEEAGLRLSSLDPVSRVWTWAPVSTERIHLYLAPYTLADRIGTGGGVEEGECIDVHEIGLDSLKELALGGKLTDSKTLILAQALMLRHPELWPELR